MERIPWGAAVRRPQLSLVNLHGDSYLCLDWCLDWSSLYDSLICYCGKNGVSPSLPRSMASSLTSDKVFNSDDGSFSQFAASIGLVFHLEREFAGVACSFFLQEYRMNLNGLKA